MGQLGQEGYKGKASRSLDPAPKAPKMMLGLKQPGAMSWCQLHKKMLPIERFDTNEKTGKLYTCCRDCKTKQHNRNVSEHGKRTHREAVAKYRKTEKGKKFTKAVSYTHLTLPTILLV